MQILSALDAISPAFSRTKLILFSPFRKGRTWKLAATAYLCAGGSVFLPFPVLGLAFLPLLREQAGVGPGVITAIVACVAFFTAVYLLLFYLLSRLRFAFFDIVLNHGAFVAPAWRKYGPQSFKWTLFKVVLGTLFAAALAVPAVPLARSMFTTLSNLHTEPGQPPSPEFLHAIFSFYAAFFFVYFFVAAFYLLSSLLSDFILPSLALEDTSLSVAFQRLAKLLRNEPGQIILYVVLKIGLFLAGAMAVGITFYIALLIVLLVATLVGGLIGFVLYLLHVSTTVLTALAVIFGIAVYLAFFGYGVFLANGSLWTFLESYTLYFLGGRYPMLGDLLTASTPPPPIPLPPPGYPPYSAPPNIL